MFVWLVEIMVHSFFLHYAVIKSCLWPLIASYLISFFICWRYHFPRILRAVNIIAWCLGIMTVLPFLIEYLGLWPFLAVSAATMAVTALGWFDRSGWTSATPQDAPGEHDKDEPPRILRREIPTVTVTDSTETGITSGEIGDNGDSFTSDQFEDVSGQAYLTTSTDSEKNGEDIVNSTEICMLLFVSCLAVTFWYEPILRIKPKIVYSHRCQGMGTLAPILGLGLLSAEVACADLHRFWLPQAVSSRFSCRSISTQRTEQEEQLRKQR